MSKWVEIVTSNLQIVMKFFLCSLVAANLVDWNSMLATNGYRYHFFVLDFDDANILITKKM